MQDNTIFSSLLLLLFPRCRFHSRLTAYSRVLSIKVMLFLFPKPRQLSVLFVGYNVICLWMCLRTLLLYYVLNVYICYTVINDEREREESELSDEGKEFGWVDDGFGANVGLFETSNESFHYNLIFHL